MRRLEVTIIIPCYNEGPTFEKSVNKILSQLKQLKKSWEVIFVEDKSTDDTKETVKKILKQIPNSKAIYHIKNLGRGKSVSDGILASTGEICGYLDVDLEVSADYIPLFVKEIKGGIDLVVGKRFYEGGFKNLTRFVSSKAYALAVKSILRLPIDDTEAGYKFFRRSKILPLLPKIRSQHWFWDTEICVLSHLAGLKIEQIPVLFKRIPDKKSTVRLVPDTIDYINNLIRLKLKLKNQNAKIQSTFREKTSSK